MVATTTSKQMKYLATLSVLFLTYSVSGFTVPTKRAISVNKGRASIVAMPLSSLDDVEHTPASLLQPTNNGHTQLGATTGTHNNPGMSLAPLIPSALVLFTALPAEAAGAVPTALVAYAHYLTILLALGAVVAQRALVKPGMTNEEEDAIQVLDLVYGISATLLIVSGYFRVTEFGKGAGFYSHELLFWLKMSFVGVWGGLSLFPTITFIKRTIARKGSSEVAPMSDKLANRLKQVMNAEISAMLSIPLLATFMSRGVLYSDDFPWPAGIVLAVLTTGGASFLYGKQALTWTEDDVGTSSQEEDKKE